MKRSHLIVPTIGMIALGCLVVGTPILRVEHASAADPIQPGASPAVRQDAADYSGQARPLQAPRQLQVLRPDGLWWRWTEDQKLGRDTWFFYTGGNQKFYRILARFGGELGISVDFFRLLDSRATAATGSGSRPDQRAELRGEGRGRVRLPRRHVEGRPGRRCVPESIRKLVRRADRDRRPAEVPQPGVHRRDEAAWKEDKKASVRKYFANPGKVEPPYLVGITCSLCHMAFDPLNPPDGPGKPRWENLAANMGNQYLREGDLFFGAGPGRRRATPTPGPNCPRRPLRHQGARRVELPLPVRPHPAAGHVGDLAVLLRLHQQPEHDQPDLQHRQPRRFHRDDPDGAAADHQPHPQGRGRLGRHPRRPCSGCSSTSARRGITGPTTSGTRPPARRRSRSRSTRSGSPGLVEPARRGRRSCAAEATPSSARPGRSPSAGSRSWSATWPRTRRTCSPTSRMRTGGRSTSPRTRAARARGTLVFADKCARCHSNKQPFYPLTVRTTDKRYFRRAGPLRQLPGRQHALGRRPLPVQLPGLRDQRGPGHGDQRRRRRHLGRLLLEGLQGPPAAAAT